MYDFTSNKASFSKLVFLLTLDKKKMTERIIIGEAVDVRLCLERGIGEVLYDETCRIGEFLFNFEADPNREWNINATYLADNFASLRPTKNVKSKAIKPYADFLRDKYKNGEPSAMFAAVKTWEDYWKCYGIHHGSDVFQNSVAKLYRPFFYSNRLWETDAISAVLFDIDSQVELWYPVKKRNLERGECIVGSTSLLPFIFYYLNKIEEWGLIFQKCKVCDNYFLTTSKHFELCGDECRKATAIEAKKQFKERNKGDKAEQLYEVTYQYWYNRLRKLKRNNAPEVEITAFSGAFEEFRNGAVERKAAVKSGKMKLQEFTAWLAEQQDIVDGMVKHGRG